MTPSADDFGVITVIYGVTTLRQIAAGLHFDF